MKIEQKYWDMAKYEPLTYLEVANKAIELQIEAQSYITAEQARELGAGYAEFQTSDNRWSVCGKGCEYMEVCKPTGHTYKYRAIKQAQPKNLEPLSSNFIQTVPDKCDRIVWRGNYYHLPIKTSIAQPEPPESDDPAYEQVWKLVEQSEPRPEPVETEEESNASWAAIDAPIPHAAICAEYAKQVAEGTTGFYLWEYHIKSVDEWLAVTWGGRPTAPSWFKDIQYRCTDISCYVSKDGEPAIRMLRTEAQALQRKLRDTVEWFNPEIVKVSAGVELEFSEQGIYNYRTKATTKLGGKMVTPAQAAAEWKAKKETHDVWVNQMLYVREDSPSFTDIEAIYELRPKQPKLKQLDWSKVPVGVMTNRGELRAVFHHQNNNKVWVDILRPTHHGQGVTLDTISTDDLRLAPAPEQKWIARQDGVCALYEGLVYIKQCDHMLCPISYKAIGLAEGYTDGGEA